MARPGYGGSVANPADTTVAEAKAAMRRRIRDTRAELDARTLARTARELRDVVLAVPEVQSARSVAAYVSVGREPGSGPLIEALHERDVAILLPIVLPDWELDWAPYTGSHRLASAPRGLLEPMDDPLGPGAVSNVDVILVPGLAADRHGTRLGKGAGCYDRALALAAGRAFSCVLLHDGELLDMPLPREPHDVPVHAAATPSGLTRLR